VGIGDVDGLKDVNDNLGHLAGDAVLVQLAKLLRQHSRRYDIVARYGGDEFGIIMPQTDRPGAIQALHRLDRAVAQATFTWYGLELQLPAISWGLASFPEDGRRSSELVAAADARMYMAKRERQVRVTAREVRPPPLEFLHGLAAEEEHGPDGRPPEPPPPQEAAGGETPPQA